MTAKDAQENQAIHSPGPWFAGELRGPEGEQTVSVGPCEKDEHFEDSVCECWHGEHDARANARLIAAAPELLDACVEIFDWLSSFAMPPTSTIKEKQAALRILNSAIEKATS